MEKEKANKDKSAVWHLADALTKLPRLPKDKMERLLALCPPPQLPAQLSSNFLSQLVVSLSAFYFLIYAMEPSKAVLKSIFFLLFQEYTKSRSD